VLLAGPCLPPLAAALGWVCDANLAILEGAVLAARSIPGSHFWTSGPALWWIVVCYAGLSAWLLLPRLRPPRRWCWGILLGWIGLGLVAAWWPSRSGELRCSFLAVGHGCSVVAELPDGRTLLYDAGQLGSPVSAARSVAGHLWSRGIGHLDAVVLSHADVDHYNALPALLKQFSVGVVYVSPAMFDQPGPALDQLRQALDGSGVPVRVLASGDRLSGGACRIEVLHPPPQGVPGSDNAHSLVLALEHQGRRVLLTGDLESPGLDEVLSDPPWPCDVLLAPHHGSAQSNPPGMALWSTPRWVVVSGGVRERAEEVIAAYTARGGQVLFTADVGTVEALLGKEGVEVRTFRSFR
jgi:competence protein ComEC